MAEIRHVFIADADDLIGVLDNLTEGSKAYGAAATKSGDKASKSLLTSEKGAKLASQAVKGVAASFVLVTGAALATAAAVVSFANRIDDVAKRAKAIGTTAEDLQIVQGAFELGGAAAEGANLALLNLNVQLGMAAKGGGEAADALKLLKISAADLESLPLPERMAFLADQLQEVPKQSDRAAAAQALLGRSAKEVLAVFAEGGDAFRENTERIRESGIVSNEAAVQAEILADAMTLARQSARSLIDRAVIPLVPAFTGVLDAVREVLNEFRNTGAMEDFGKTIADVFLGVAAPAVAVAVGEIVKGFSALKVALASIDVGVQRARIALLFLKGDFEGAEQAMGDLTAKEKDLNLALGDLGAKQEDVGDRTAQFLAKLDEVRRGLGTAETAASGLGGGLDDLGDGAGSAGESIEQIDEALEASLSRFDDFINSVGLGGNEIQETFLAIASTVEEVIPTALEVAEEAFQRFKETWNEGLGDILNAVGQLAIQVVGIFEDMARETTQTRVSEAKKTQREIEAIEEALTEAVDEQEKARLTSERNRLQKQSEAQKEAALKSFRTQKALALVSAGINTALAVINAFATAPTIVAGVVLAIIAGAAGAVSIAAIAASKPPSFHRGGILRASDVPGNTSRDTVMVRAKAGEGFLNTQGARAAGGEAGIDALNRGQAPNQGMSVNLFKVGGRFVEATTHMALRSNKSRLTTAIRATQPKIGRHIPSRRR